MAKSLTDTAKAILMKEGAIPSVSMSDSNPDRDTKASNPNRATLRPGSKYAEMKPFSNPGAMAPSAPDNQVQDLGPALVKQGDVPPSAKAAGGAAKDTSRSSQAGSGRSDGEKFGVDSEKKQDRKSKEIMEEDVEISEELESFIKEMLEQGLSEEEIAQAIEENFELVEAKHEDEDEDEDKERMNEEDQVDEAAKWRSVKKAQMKNPAYDPDDDNEDPAPKYISKGDKEIPYEQDLSKRGKSSLYKKGPKTGKVTPAASGLLKSMIKTSLGKHAGPKHLPEEEQIDMAEHIEALFQGEELSEEFREKATTIFEAAVTAKLEEEVARIQEAYAETLDEQVQEITENLSSNVDDYLNYVVEQWVNENEVAIEAGLRTELTEDFITGLRQLFAENYIDIPEDKVSVVEELGTKVEELEKKLNEEIDRNVKLNKSLNESKRFEILVDACDGLTTTQTEKLKSLAEGVEFTTANEFTTKVKTLRENYFPATVNADKVLDKAEAEVAQPGKVLNEEISGPMAAYVRTLGKKLPN